jgi:ACT domain-containing protein
MARTVKKNARSPKPATAKPDAGVVIVTVVGKNRPGVLAEVTGAIGDLNGNIMDISQKMIQDYFNLIMIVDLATATVPFDVFQKKLESLGAKKGYSTHVQHEKVFRYMHRV